MKRFARFRVGGGGGGGVRAGYANWALNTRVVYFVSLETKIKVQSTINYSSTVDPM